MLTALTMGNDSFNDAVYGAMTNAFAYRHNSIVQLTVYNWDAGFHPFHLHGYVPFLFLVPTFPLNSLAEHYADVVIGLKQPRVPTRQQVIRRHLQRHRHQPSS